MELNCMIWNGNNDVNDVDEVNVYLYIIMVVVPWHILEVYNARQARATVDVAHEQASMCSYDC